MAKTAAASVELTTAADQQRDAPGQPSSQTPTAAVTDDADHDPDRGQREPRPDRPAHVGPPRGQTALGEDDHQRRDPEGLGQRDVLEVDAEPALPQRDAERQVEQQAGQPEPVGQPQGDRGDQDDERRRRPAPTVTVVFTGRRSPWAQSSVPASGRAAPNAVWPVRGEWTP